MKSTIIGCFVLVVTNAQAFDFKGIEVGGPAVHQPEQVESALGVRCSKGSNDMLVCNGVTTVAGAVAFNNTVVSPTGIVTRISLSFDADKFEMVAPALIAKFGKPTKSSTRDVQNRMGATFQDVTHRWAGAGGRYIELKKYSGSIDESSLYFGSAEDTALLNELSKPNVKDL